MCKTKMYYHTHCGKLFFLPLRELRFLNKKKKKRQMLVKIKSVFFLFLIFQTKSWHLIQCVIPEYVLKRGQDIIVQKIG